jgi:hypothetical protein
VCEATSVVQILSCASIRSPCGRSKKPSPKPRTNLPVGSNSISGFGPRASTKMLPLELIATPDTEPKLMLGGSEKSSGTAT